MMAADMLSGAPRLMLADAIKPLVTREDWRAARALPQHTAQVATKCAKMDGLHGCALFYGHTGPCACMGCDHQWTAPKAEGEPITDADLCWYGRYL